MSVKTYAIRTLAKQARLVPVAARSTFSTSGILHAQRSYADAITCLNTRQSGFKVLAERLKAGIHLEDDVVDQMRHCLRLVGHEPSDLDALNVVHIAGTKGKGTTCAFVNSMLMACQKSLGKPRKIGLYTSPHLVSVRERIRINAKPISEELFAEYFFEVWEALEAAPASLQRPSYFRFLTLVSFHAFLREKVDVAIYEVGVGGELDSTNVFNRPAATGVTTLGIDHVQTLGSTIDQIAWHKAGIFKKGSPAFTVPQVPDAVPVLNSRAAERRTHLEWIHPIPALRKVKLSPMEDFQINNASIAVRLTTTVLEKLGVTISSDGSQPPKLLANSASRGPTASSDQELPREFIDGLENVQWRGRCETKVVGDERFYLDGAHTEGSLEVACAWFGKVTADSSLPRILIFNQQSSRDAPALLRVIHRIMSDTYDVRFTHVIFCTNVTFKNGDFKLELVNMNVDSEALSTLSHQKILKEQWLQLDPTADVSVIATIEGAREHVRDIAEAHGGAQTLVTGSFHLVGGFLSILEGSDYGLESLVDTARMKA